MKRDKLSNCVAIFIIIIKFDQELFGIYIFIIFQTYKQYRMVIYLT